MTPGPVLRRGRLTVVTEGAGRIRWRRSSPARWWPAELWPSAEEAATVLRRIRDGDPVLVVFNERAPATVPVLADELAVAPPALASLAEGADGEVVDLRIPPLDWMPDEMRCRGLLFLRASTKAAARSPRPLAPPLVLDTPAGDLPNLRFALRRGCCCCSARIDLVTLAADLLGVTESAGCRHDETSVQ